MGDSGGLLSGRGQFSVGLGKGDTGGQGPQGPQGPEGPAGPSIVVLDALGAEVGRVLDVINSETLTIPLRVSGHTIMLFANKEGFFRNDQFPLFESSDCSGTPLMRKPTPSLFSTVTVGSPGHTVYLPDPDASFQNILIKSVLKPNGCDLQLPLRTFLVVPAIPLVDLDTLFTPPFEFELQ